MFDGLVGLVCWLMELMIDGNGFARFMGFMGFNDLTDAMDFFSPFFDSVRSCMIGMQRVYVFIALSLSVALFLFW